MSVTNTPRKAGPYTGNNTDVQYTFGFKVFADSDLVVTRAVIATGTESTLVLTTDYSVTRNADQDVDPGGYITLTAALADTYTLTLTSAVPDTQPAVFTNLGGFFPAVLNNALDRLTILVQQLKETVGRSLKLAVSTPTGFDATLPAPVAYGVLGFNGTADGFAVTDPSGTSALAGDLSSTSDPSKGAGLVGDDPDLDYPDKTVGYMIKIANQPVNILKAFSKTEAAAIQAKTSTTNHQSVLADVLANERSVYFPYGKYNANAAINLGSHNVSIYGHFDAEIAVTDGAFTFLRYTGAQRFEIRGLKIYGTEHTAPTVKLLQIDTSSAYFLIDGTEFAYASQDLILDGCYIGKVRGTKHSNSDVFLKIAASLASSTDLSVQEATFGSSSVGTSSLVQISAPDIQLNGYWETQQKVKASLEILSGGRPTVSGRLVDSGAIIARTSALLDLDVIMTNSWDSVNNYAIRADGGSLVDLNSSYIRATSFATGITGVSGSGTLRGAGFEVANFATGISSSSDVLLSAGAVSGCTTGIVASGSGIVGPIDYSSNTTNATISGTVVQYQDLVGTATYDPPNLAGGATQQVNVTVTGAAVGDIASVSFSVANAGISWSAEVTATDTVTVTQRNMTGGAIDLASGTLKVRVRK